MLHYVRPTLSVLWNFQAPALTVLVDGQKLAENASYCLIANVRSYGGPFEIAGRTPMAHGLMADDIEDLLEEPASDVAQQFADVVLQGLGGQVLLAEVAGEQELPEFLDQVDHRIPVGQGARVDVPRDGLRQIAGHDGRHQVGEPGGGGSVQLGRCMGHGRLQCMVFRQSSIH